MPTIPKKKLLPEPPLHALTSAGFKPTHDLRNVSDAELVAELIRRGWRGFSKETSKPKGGRK